MFSVRPSSRSTPVSQRWSATVAAAVVAVAVVVAGAVAVVVAVEVEAGAAETRLPSATLAGKDLRALQPGLTEQSRLCFSYSFLACGKAF